MDRLDVEDARRRLISGCEAIVAARDQLTDADRRVGDGDHGVGMARGFSAAADAVRAKEAASAGELFRAVGMAVLSKSGGASGAVFGTFFTSAAGPLGEAAVGPEMFVEALEAGLSAVRKRGGAKPGDKTVVDALDAALADARQAAPGGLGDCLEAAAEGARRGAEATTTMKAATGKARSLGDRSIGHIDPGALSMSIFLRAFAG